MQMPICNLYTHFVISIVLILLLCAVSLLNLGSHSSPQLPIIFNPKEYLFPFYLLPVLVLSSIYTRSRWGRLLTFILLPLLPSRWPEILQVFSCHKASTDISTVSFSFRVQVFFFFTFFLKMFSLFPMLHLWHSHHPCVEPYLYCFKSFLHLWWIYQNLLS